MIPNPLHRGSKRESLFLSVTPKLMMVVAVPIIAYSVPGALASLTRPPPARMPAPYALEVPPLDYTADSASMPVLALLQRLPPPGPNQKRAEQCDPEQDQEPINGGCWVQTKRRPPCPEGKQWEHEGKCWLPVAHARPVPSSGGALPVSVAGEAE